jgi:hypothetical protein
MLSTTTVGFAVPSFKEEYGADKRLDIVGTMSHSFISNMIEGTSRQGLSILPDGTIKILFNIGA